MEIVIERQEQAKALLLDRARAAQPYERAMLGLLSRACVVLDDEPGVKRISSKRLAERALDLADPQASSPPLVRAAALAYLEELATEVMRAFCR